MKVGVIDYGIASNIYNIVKAVEAAGGEVSVIKRAEYLKDFDKYIIPGVGSFPDAMLQIREKGLEETLKTELLSKPTLGICLGMQILCKVGFEFEETKGLNLIDAEVIKICCKGKRPRMGFGQIEIISENPLLDGITSSDEFYFMHSYEVVNYTDVISLTTYNDHRYVCGIQKGNLYGVQFHPEKSRDAGIKVLKNFINL